VQHTQNSNACDKYRSEYQGANNPHVPLLVDQSVSLRATRQCGSAAHPDRTLAFIEASDGRFQAECLNAHWFMSLADGRKKMEDRHKYCNEETARWGDRPKDADYVAQSRWCCQPAIVSEPEKIYPPAIQCSASLHNSRGSNAAG
jgi:hypothetical protein